MIAARSRLATLVGLILIVSSAELSALSAQQHVEVGNAASVAGDVSLDNSQLKRPIKVKRRQRIAWGDLIETKKRAQLQILLLDRSNFGIGQRSRVRIDRYVYDPNTGRNVLVSFIKGALRFFSGSDEGQNSGEVVTPAGRIGIRGTAVDMLVGKKAESIAEDESAVGSVRSDDDEATLVVLRGPGENALSGVTPGLVEVTGADVTVVLDEPGLAAYIPRNGAAPIGPFRISSPALAKVQYEITPRWARTFGGVSDGAVAGGILAGIVGALILSRGGSDGSGNQSDDTTASDNPDTRSTSGQGRICRNANGERVIC